MEGRSSVLIGELAIKTANVDPFEIRLAVRAVSCLNAFQSSANSGQVVSAGRLTHDD